jgi:hypothetical protein
MVKLVRTTSRIGSKTHDTSFPDKVNSVSSRASLGEDIEDHGEDFAQLAESARKQIVIK